jgi:hypothetical protein
MSAAPRDRSPGPRAPLWALALLLGCELAPGPTPLACEDDTACPPGQACVQINPFQRRCAPALSDAGPRRDATPDATPVDAFTRPPRTRCAERCDRACAGPGCGYCPVACRDLGCCQHICAALCAGDEDRCGAGLRRCSALCEHLHGLAEAQPAVTLGAPEPDPPADPRCAGVRCQAGSVCDGDTGRCTPGCARAEDCAHPETMTCDAKTGQCAFNDGACSLTRAEGVCAPGAFCRPDLLRCDAEGERGRCSCASQDPSNPFAPLDIPCPGDSVCGFFIAPGQPPPTEGSCVPAPR